MLVSKVDLMVYDNPISAIFSGPDLDTLSIWVVDHDIKSSDFTDSLNVPLTLLV